MQTLAEVVSNFTPIGKLNATQNMAILRMEKLYKELATDIIEYVPESPARFTALRTLLESKFMCIHAITHTPTPEVKNEKKA